MPFLEYETYVNVEVDIAELETEDLIDVLESRGYTVLGDNFSGQEKEIESALRAIEDTAIRTEDLVARLSLMRALRTIEPLLT